MADATRMTISVDRMTVGVDHADTARLDVDITEAFELRGWPVLLAYRFADGEQVISSVAPIEASLPPPGLDAAIIKRECRTVTTMLKLCGSAEKASVWCRHEPVSTMGRVLLRAAQFEVSLGRVIEEARAARLTREAAGNE